MSTTPPVCRSIEMLALRVGDAQEDVRIGRPGKSKMSCAAREGECSGSRVRAIAQLPVQVSVEGVGVGCRSRRRLGRRSRRRCRCRCWRLADFFGDAHRPSRVDAALRHAAHVDRRIEQQLFDLRAIESRPQALDQRRDARDDGSSERRPTPRAPADRTGRAGIWRNPVRDILTQLPRFDQP